MTNRLIARLLDRTEATVWTGHCERLEAAGFEVTREGRWARTYRDPRVADALASAREVEAARTRGFDVEADPEYAAHAAHSLPGEPDCAYCPPTDDFAVEAEPFGPVTYTTTRKVA